MPFGHVSPRLIGRLRSRASAVRCVSDEIADLAVDSGAATTAARFPAPIGAKAAPMPANPVSGLTTGIAFKIEGTVGRARQRSVGRCFSALLAIGTCGSRRSPAAAGPGFQQCDMSIDFAISAVVVCAIPLRANKSIAPLTRRSRVASFCSWRVAGGIAELLLTEYLLIL